MRREVVGIPRVANAQTVPVSKWATANADAAIVPQATRSCWALRRETA